MPGVPSGLRTWSLWGLCQWRLPPAWSCDPGGVGVAFPALNTECVCGWVTGSQSLSPAARLLLRRGQRCGVPDGRAHRPPAQPAGPAGAVSAAPGLRHAGASAPTGLPAAGLFQQLLPPLDPGARPGGRGEWVPHPSTPAGTSLSWETERSSRGPAALLCRATFPNLASLRRRALKGRTHGWWGAMRPSGCWVTRQLLASALGAAFSSP